MQSSKAVLWIAALVSLSMPMFCFGQTKPSKFADKVSYDQEIQPIVYQYCLTCHQGKEPAADLDLSTFKSVKDQTKVGDLLERINDHENPMPQSGLMPKQIRRLFKKWADGGYERKGNPAKGKKMNLFGKFKAPKIVPVDINKKGFDFLEKMQGHWVGKMNLMGQNFDWFAFDFRAIAPSHVHGIFEGGTIGNLFTSFFIANYKGKRTIMARNGGILNGIYRTSYFVLDKVETVDGKKSYRFVDAYGGKDIMWMELKFKGNQIWFNAYTSRMGLVAPAKRHMTFHGKRMHPELAKNAAKAVGFPKNVVEKDFSKGLPKPNWGPGVQQTSASYLWEEAGKSIEQLGRIARDPIRIDQMPYLSKLKIKIQRSQPAKNKKLQVYLSSKPLCDTNGKFITQYGYIREDHLNTILMFPELGKKDNEFTLTYLHPGEYYLTVVADLNEDGFPSEGDITHKQIRLKIKPKTSHQVLIDKLDVRN